MRSRTAGWIATLALVTLGVAAGSNGATAAASGASVVGSADLVVRGLPGADLGDVTLLPGLSASSGPFPTVTTGVSRRGRTADVVLEGRASPSSAVGSPKLVEGTFFPERLVLDRTAAAAAGARVGDRVTVSTGNRPASLLVSGIAEDGVPAGDASGRVMGTGYIGTAMLERIVTRRRNLSSTFYVRLADSSDAARYARWFEQRYPGHQVAVYTRARPASTGVLTVVLWTMAVLLLVTGFATVTVTMRFGGAARPAGAP